MEGHGNAHTRDPASYIPRPWESIAQKSYVHSVQNRDCTFNLCNEQLLLIVILVLF